MLHSFHTCSPRGSLLRLLGKRKVGRGPDRKACKCVYEVE